MRQRQKKRVMRKKRAWRKKRGNNRLSNISSIAVNRLVQRPLFPLKYKATLTYSATQGVSINPGVAGAVGSYLFRANSLYDPDVTSVGHQPMGFDQIMSVYDHYYVIGSRITVSWNNGDTTYQQIAGIYLADSQTIPTTAEEIIENSKGVYCLLQPSPGAGSTCTLYLKYSPRKFFGTKTKLDNDEQRGTSSSNPAEDVYYVLWGAPNFAADSTALGGVVRIEYLCVFTEPKMQSLS